MSVYALVDDRLRRPRPLDEVVELYASRVRPERILRAGVRGEPSWAPYVRVVELRLHHCTPA